MGEVDAGTRSEKVASADELLRVRDVQRVLDVPRTMAYKLVSDGVIASVRVGRLVRVRRSEAGRVLHEAEATTERHKRIPVEVPQGPAGGNAPRLVHVGDRSVPVAPRAVERNLPRAAGVPEHAELPAARRAAPVGTVAGMLPEMLEDVHLVPLPRPSPNSCSQHSIPPRGRAP